MAVTWERLRLAARETCSRHRTPAPAPPPWLRCASIPSLAPAPSPLCTLSPSGFAYRTTRHMTGYASEQHLGVATRLC